MSEPIRILHVLGGLSLGGAESRIMDLYRNLNREEIQFDFLVHAAEEQHFDKEIQRLGGRIYRVPKFKLYNWFSYKKALRRFFAEHHEFRAVHGHMTSTASIYLPLAKKAGIPIAIAHSRSAGTTPGLKGAATRWLRHSLKRRADICLACSREAGEAVYGRKWMKQGRVEVIPNAIAADKYVYDEKERRRLREELGLENRLVIGHVGSFRAAKNHTFLIQVFAKIHEKRPDAVLLLLGAGELMEEIRRQTTEAGLEDAVLFLGNRADVSPYYQAMDYLVFPSLYEGLPGTVVEAQTSGLKCLISDRISREVCLTELVTVLPLERSPEEWAEQVLRGCEYERKDRLDRVKEAGFDIGAQLERYRKLYRKNLLLVVPMLHQGGFERICVMTARLLQDICNVRIAVFSKKDMFYDVTGLELTDLNVGSVSGYLGKAGNVLRRIRRLRRLKREKNIHITYSFGMTANMVNSLSKEQDEIWLGLRSYGDLENAGMMKLFCRRADRMICCTRMMEDELTERFHPKQADTLYNPCDVEKIRSLAGEELCEAHQAFFNQGGQPVLAAMGREDDVKGYWHLLKAFSLLKKELPDARLILIGDGSFAEYRRLAEELGIQESVLFTGARKNPFAYLQEASLFVMTSVLEGFPNALIEAMALGVPVMSVNCKTGPAEILLEDYREGADEHAVTEGDYGVLLPVICPEKNLDAGVIEEEEKVMAAEALRILQDPERFQERKRAAEKRSGAFSVERYVEQISGWINGSQKVEVFSTEGGKL